MSQKIRIAIFVVAAVVFAYSAGKLIWTFYQYYSSNRAYEEIRQEALIEDEAAFDEAGEITPPQIDFDALQQINPDIIGWLWIPDSPISYPILCGSNNQEYLRATYERKYSVLGSIFQDYRDQRNFEDFNTIIYGHNTRNDAMFGSLKKYKNAEYANAHKDIYILTREASLVYEVFSVYETPATSDTYTIRFESELSFSNYLKKVASQSIVKIGTEPQAEHIITLSTCTGGDQAMRLVLQARFIDFIPVLLTP